MWLAFVGFILPWLALLAGVGMLLVPRRQKPVTQRQVEVPRQAA